MLLLRCMHFLKILFTLFSADALNMYIFILQPTVNKIEKTMLTREAQMKKVKDQMNNVEDQLFVEFCQEIGVENIR